MPMAVLTILLTAVLGIAYRVEDRDLMAPSVLFPSGFVACAVMALVFSGIWGFTLHLTAFVVLLGGVVLFLISALAVRHIVRGRVPLGRRKGSDVAYLSVSWWILLLFVVLQAITLVWSIMQIANMFPAESMMSSINLYDQAAKFSDDMVPAFSFPLGPMRNMCNAYEMLLCYLLAQALAFRNLKNMPLLVVSFLLGVAVSLETGGRASFIGYVVFAVVCFVLIRSQMLNGPMRLGRWGLLALAIVGVVLIVAFQLSLELLGRGKVTSFWDYLSIYVGAEIPNLDTFLETVGQQDHGIWGYMTFITSIRWLGTKFGVPAWVYQLDLPRQVMSGHDLGNVYTTFYAPIYDFGYWGLGLMVVMGAVSQLVYEKARSAGGSRFSCIWVIVYANLAYALLMSFFSNKFFEDFFAIGMLRTVGYLLVVYAALFVRPDRQRHTINGTEQT